MNLFKKFLAGAAYGAGFTVACIVALSIWANFWLKDGVISSSSQSTNPSISSAPEIVEEFLGTTGCSSGHFDYESPKDLVEGSGEITGRAFVNGKGVAGLRLKLMLNGTVYSAWGESDSEGVYTIAVPYGEYRVNGYSLDSSSAARVLAGKIQSPDQNCSGGRIYVADGQPGHGLDFKFVDPVALVEPRGELSIGNPIFAKWEPYPGAHSYRIQVYKSLERSGWRGNDRLFKWDDRPIVTSEEFEITGITNGLEVDHWYTIEIEALDQEGIAIASTASPRNHRDFRAIE